MKPKIMKSGVLVAKNLKFGTIATKILSKSAVRKKDMNWKKIPFEGRETTLSIDRLNMFKSERANTINQKDLSSKTM